MDLKSPIILQIDNSYVEECVKKKVDEIVSNYLRVEWLTMSDLEKITRHKRDWIMKYIIEDPYVRKNKIAKKDGPAKNSQWIVHAERVRPFLERLFDSLPDC